MLLPAALAIFLVCCIFGHNNSFAFWEKDLTYEGESVYNYLQVYEDDERVGLSTNVLFGVQSILPKNGTLTGMYYDYALAAPLMAGSETHTGPLSLLVLGMGTGTYANQCLRYFPGMEIEGVEIDGKITELAWRFFAMPDEVKVTEYDGRAFLQAFHTYNCRSGNPLLNKYMAASRFPAGSGNPRRMC